jgi:RNA polymerase sigma-70 factor (ECF subfamily)
MFNSLGDPDTFAVAYREHSRRAFGAAMRVLGDPVAAEDVVQDVFAGLWRHPNRYDARRGPLGPFVAMMARSRALDRHRSHAAERAAVDRVTQETRVRPTSGGDPLDTVMRRRLFTALEELPRAQRQALVASACGLSGTEIAGATGVPLGTAKSRIRHGMIRARAALA